MNKAREVMQKEAEIRRAVATLQQSSPQIPAAVNPTSKTKIAYLRTDYAQPHVHLVAGLITEDEAIALRDWLCEMFGPPGTPAT